MFDSITSKPVRIFLFMGNAELYKEKQQIHTNWI